jgi:predicted glutamine amidotransferase
MEKMYDNQKGRGRDGFGFVEVLDDEVNVKRFVFEQDFLDELKRSKSNHILCHHRIPTSTSNNTKSNHPIVLDDDGYKHNYYFIHNGNINNAKELREEHEKMGLKYTTDSGDQFTDSEALAHEIALIAEGINEPKDFNAKGGLAFIMIQTDKCDNPVALYFGRNYNNPIKIYQTKDSLTLRSEGDTGEIVDTNKLFRYDYKTKETTMQEVNFNGFVSRRERTIELPKTNENPLTDAIIELYENKYISAVVLNGLTEEELKIILVIAKRVSIDNQMQLERKLLTSSNNELALLRAHYNTLVRTIQNVELKIK